MISLLRPTHLASCRKYWIYQTICPCQSFSFIVVLYANIKIPKIQTQSSESRVFKSCFSSKVRQKTFEYRIFSFSNTWLNLQSSLQYIPLIFFSTSAIFHPTISPPHVFLKPSLQFLPTLLSSIPQLFLNSLLLHTAILTVPTKIFFTYLNYSANSSFDKGPMSETVWWGMTLF